MRIVNLTDYATDEVESLVRFAFREVDSRGVLVLVSYTRRGVTGGQVMHRYAYAGPHADARTRYVVRVRVGRPELFPSAPFQQGRRACWPVFEYATWHEAVVATAAHEAKHIEAWRERIRHDELRCETFARWTLDRYHDSLRSQTENAGVAGTTREEVAMSDSAPKKVTIREAAVAVLRKAGKPLHKDELAKRVIAYDGVTIRAADPVFSVTHLVYMDAKKDDGAFSRIPPAVFGLRGHAATEQAIEAATDAASAKKAPAARKPSARKAAAAAEKSNEFIAKAEARKAAREAATGAVIHVDGSKLIEQVAVTNPEAAADLAETLSKKAAAKPDPKPAKKSPRKPRGGKAEALVASGPAPFSADARAQLEDMGE